MRIAIASSSSVPAQFPDDERLAEALRGLGAEPEVVAWDEPGRDWSEFAAVVINSTWGYALRCDEFLRWCDAVGERLHNAPALVRWNADKRYLRDLDLAGIPVVATLYVEPGERPPALDGEVVIKPNVSAGARDTGRFGPATHGEATALIEAIQVSGRTALVQAYEPSVDTVGETAVLLIDGEPAHALRKRAVLRPDEVAPLRDDAIGAAEAMYDPELVTAAEAGPAEIANARAAVAHLAERFGSMPLYARVDTVAGPGGEPLLLELEAIEPNFYLGQVPATAELVARALLARVA